LAVAAAQGVAPPGAHAAPRQMAAVDPATLGAGTIDRIAGRNGDSLVELIDMAHKFASPATPDGQLPCAWACVKPSGGGGCRRHADPQQTCPKCVHGSQPLMATLRAVKVATSATLLATLPAKAPLKQA